MTTDPDDRPLPKPPVADPRHQEDRSRSSRFFLMFVIGIAVALAILALIGLLA